MALYVEEATRRNSLGNVLRRVPNLTVEIAVRPGVISQILAALAFVGFIDVPTSVETNHKSPFANGPMIMQEANPFSQSRAEVATEEVVCI